MKEDSQRAGMAQRLRCMLYKAGVEGSIPGAALFCRELGVRCSKSPTL